MNSKPTDWLLALAFVASAAGYLWWLYNERQDAKIRMADHQWMMDQVKVDTMRKGFNE